ncbi:hypothetical protein [Chromatium okenii]|jgi:hypothetical protein|uniref:hypothetical protein n=1 Tax=Chromatium okenii TaxID=61644 RepID=UPI0026ECA977|nr:hypothetical protein [Chromatium okenii]MBV5310757.1 hypothetical protein [Chromatium okenii]
MSALVLIAPGRRQAVVFQVGAKGVGIEIMAHHTLGAAASDMQYLVRYACCEKEAVLSQKQVLSRIHNESECCNACRLKRRKQRAKVRFAERMLRMRQVEQPNVRHLAMSGSWK